MGIYATVYVDNDIDLPYFPDEIDRTDMAWQSKQGINVYAGPYRITSDERLERKEVSHREKTPEEKQSEAEKWGFDSWEEYIQAYENNNNDEKLYPPEVDYNPNEDDEHPPIFPSEKTVDETWWADHNMHGTFEFHKKIKRDPIEYETTLDPSSGTEIERPAEYALDICFKYEARFTRGDLDEIVFLGERGRDRDSSVESTLEKIEEWREWKEKSE